MQYLKDVDTDNLLFDEPKDDVAKIDAMFFAATEETCRPLGDEL